MTFIQRLAWVVSLFVLLGCLGRKRQIGGPLESWPFLGKSYPISMFNPRKSQVGKGGLPPPPSLHSNSLGSGGKPPFPT